MATRLERILRLNVLNLLEKIVWMHGMLCALFAVYRQTSVGDCTFLAKCDAVAVVIVMCRSMYSLQK